MSRSKRTELFERGAAAAARVFARPGVYICPICGDAFDKKAAETGELTLEHVPPAALGGKAVALTCRPCNNTAGHTVDAAVHQRDNVNQFARLILSNQEGPPERAVLTIGGEEVNVAVSRGADGKTKFSIMPALNDPAALRRVQQYMDRLTALESAKGERFRVRSRASYHARLAKIGDLRAAYIAAFAAFGYRYAFAPALEPVRAQIQSPNENIIPDSWSIRINTDQDLIIVLNKSPSCLIVKLIGPGVLLPWLTSPTDLYEQLAPDHARGGSIQITGHLVEWTSSLRMALDFAV